MVFDSSSDEEETPWSTTDSSQDRVDHCNITASRPDSSDLWAASAPQVEAVTSKDTDIWAASAYIPSNEESDEQDGRELNETWSPPEKVVVG